VQQCSGATDSCCQRSDTSVTFSDELMLSPPTMHLLCDISITPFSSAVTMCSLGNVLGLIIGITAVLTAPASAARSAPLKRYREQETSHQLDHAAQRALQDTTVCPAGFTPATCYNCGFEDVDDFFAGWTVTGSVGGYLGYSQGGSQCAVLIAAYPEGNISRTFSSLALGTVLSFYGNLVESRVSVSATAKVEVQVNDRAFVVVNDLNNGEATWTAGGTGSGYGYENW
jgi:hypothetical protein